MAIAEVTAQRNTVSGTLSNAYPNNVTIGSLLVVGIAGAGPLLTISATGSGAPTSWAQINLQLVNASDVHTYIAWGIATATGACTVAITGLTFVSMTVTEFTGASDVAGLPLPSWGRGINTGPAVTQPLVPDGALVLGIVTYAGTATIAQAGGWALSGEYETYASNYTHSLINQVASGAGTYTPTWTTSGTVTWASMAIVILEPSSGGGGGGSCTFLG
jgi:hypothetical protein